MTSLFVPGDIPAHGRRVRRAVCRPDLAAKDLFDVAGHSTGGGNPDWVRRNPIPTRHAWAVQRLHGARSRLYGIRPTHGRLDVTGMMPQAPSSDTIGWFARDAATFARMSEALLGEPIPGSLPPRLGFGFADADTAAAFEPMVRKLSAIVGTCAGTCWPRRACRPGRWRSGRFGRARPGSPSGTGSIATTRACSGAWRAASFRVLSAL